MSRTSLVWEIKPGMVLAYQHILLSVWSYCLVKVYIATDPNSHFLLTWLLLSYPRAGLKQRHEIDIPGLLRLTF